MLPLEGMFECNHLVSRLPLNIFLNPTSVTPSFNCAWSLGDYSSCILLYLSIALPLASFVHGVAPTVASLSALGST